MPAKPGKNETEAEFMSRCIHIEVGNGHPQPQAVAMCASMWTGKKKAVVEDKACKPKKPKKP